MSKRLLIAVSIAALGTITGTSLSAQATATPQSALKRGLYEADWAYKLADGVTYKDVSYYSDDMRTYARVFYPKGYSATGKIPAVVLGQGWAGHHWSIEKYGARFAERGLVAMVIDYRGWGLSDGFVTLAEPLPKPKEVTYPDERRHLDTTVRVHVKRTRLLPQKMIEDYRSAISYVQGEPGVDPERIGLWGSSFAGGHALTAASLDLRVKALSVQVPSVAGYNVPEGPRAMSPAVLKEAIQLARTGRSTEFLTGYSAQRMVDIETNEAVANNFPFHRLKYIGNRPVQFIVAENEELTNNKTNAYAAMEVLTGPKNLISVKTTHFGMYIDEAFEISSNAAAAWFLKYLK